MALAAAIGEEVPIGLPSVAARWRDTFAHVANRLTAWLVTHYHLLPLPLRYRVSWLTIYARTRGAYNLQLPVTTGNTGNR